MWIWYTTADPATDTIYMTIGSPSPNYYGGDRPGNNLFGESLVAVELETGRRVWHYQFVRHDVWDRDLPQAPVLVTVRRGGRSIPAVAKEADDPILPVPP